MGGIWFLVVSTAVSWLYLLPTFTPVRIDCSVPFLFPLLPGIIGAWFQFRKSRTKTADNIVADKIMPDGIIADKISDNTANKTAANRAGNIIDRDLLSCTLNNTSNTPDKPGDFVVPCTNNGMVVIAVCLVVTFFLFLIQGILTPVIYTIMSRFHEVKFLNHMIVPVVNFFGLNVSISDGIIYIPTFKNLLAFPGLLEKLNLYVLFYIFAGGVFIIFLLEATIKNFIRFFTVLMIYAYFRYLLLIFIYAQVGRAEIYWNPLISSLSFFPLAFFLWWFVPVGQFFIFPSFLNLSFKMFSKNNIKILTFVFISVFCLTGLFLFHDPGTEKQGRILINENHSDWEWCTKKFDTTWYGRKSTYNYYCMVDYFRHYYSVDQNLKQQLSPEFLSDYDILIIKTPTEPYSEEEIKSIVQFVEKGGGLWLIGDHTNVFGMSYYINFIAKKFGLFFQYDSTYDLTTGRLSRYIPPGILAHPIVRNMPPFLFATSCTLSAPFFAEDVMTGYGLRTRLLSYSGRGFFHQDPTTDYEFGLFLQNAAVKYGRGRVSAFTDSTCFSNFYMFIPGKPELAMGTIEWLNRENRFNYFKYIFAVIFICFSFFTVKEYKKSTPCHEKNIAATGVIFSIVFLAVSILFFTFFNKINYQNPEPHTDYKSVAFESAHSNIVLPVKKLVDKAPNNYHTFYVWTQRLEYVPSLTKNLKDAVNNDIVVIINPTIPFSEQELKLIEKYVNQGGKILLLDDPQNRNSTSNQVLKIFEMEITSKLNKKRVLDIFHTQSGKKMFKAKNTGFIKGGIQVLQTEKRKSYFSVKTHGKGAVGVMADSSIFANKDMGGTQIVPNEKQKSIYMLEFFLFQTMEQ